MWNFYISMLTYHREDVLKLDVDKDIIPLYIYYDETKVLAGILTKDNDNIILNVRSVRRNKLYTDLLIRVDEERKKDINTNSVRVSYLLAPNTKPKIVIRNDCIGFINMLGYSRKELHNFQRSCVKLVKCCYRTSKEYYDNPFMQDRVGWLFYKFSQGILHY